MKSYMTCIVICTFTLLQSCSSSELVENWKNPEIDVFTAQKVLVLAMSNDVKNRQLFEKKLVKELKDKGVNAVNSDDFFNPAFTSRPRTKEELDDFAERLEDVNNEKEEIRLSIFEDYSNTINSQELPFQFKIQYNSAKEVYTVEKDPASYYAVKQLQRNINKTFKVIQADRNKIIKQIKSFQIITSILVLSFLFEIFFLSHF